jgi:hypothetical protein
MNPTDKILLGSILVIAVIWVVGLVAMYFQDRKRKKVQLP